MNMPVQDKKVRIAGQWKLLMWLRNLIGACADDCTYLCHKYLKIQNYDDLIERYISHISQEACAKEIRMSADNFKVFPSGRAGFVDIEIRIRQEGLGMIGRDEEEEESETEEDDLIHRLLENPGQLNAMKIHLTNTDLLGYRDPTNGDTSIHQAVRTGDKTIFKQVLLCAKFQLGSLLPLIKYRSLLQTPNNKGDTPLHIALKRHQKEMAINLIKDALDMAYMLNDRGMSPFNLAIKAGYKDFVEVVFQQAAQCPSGKHKLDKLLTAKKSPISCAIKAKDTGMLDVLLDNIPHLMDISNRKGLSPLSYAARHGYIDKVCYFLNKFPERGFDKSFPIHHAVAGGHLDVVKEFLSRYPEMIYCTDNKNRSILHVSVEYARPDILSYMVNEPQMKQIFHLRDRNGNTFVGSAKKLMQR